MLSGRGADGPAAAAGAPGPTGSWPVTVVTGVGLALPGDVLTARHLAEVSAGAAAAGAALDGRPGGESDGRPGGGRPVDPSTRIGRKGLRYKDRATQLALVAADAALREGGLLSGTGPGLSLAVPGGAVGVVVSSNYGNLDSIADVVRTVATDGGTRLVRPMVGPILSSNVIASETAIRFGLRGPNLMVCNGATGGLDALRWAVTWLGADRAGHVLVVGTEPDNEVVRSLVGRPLLDGAVALLVERATSARSRGARIQARLGRYARTGDLPQCLSALSRHEPAVAGWYPPERLTVPDDLLPGVPRYDLSAAWRAGSGASGVLRCADAVGRFAGGAPGPVYAVVGSGEACAGLALWPGDGWPGEGRSGDGGAGDG